VTHRGRPEGWHPNAPFYVVDGVEAAVVKAQALAGDRIVEAAPEVVSHNMETVRRLTRQVRIQAQYDRSLEVLRYLKANGVNRTKTGIMLGLGETEDELYQTLDEVRSVGVDVVTLGQYLQPSARHLPVQRFVEPEEFERLGAYARTLGFRHVESSPLVRSSYHAERHVH
jgi:lipoic acid synthetase